MYKKESVKISIIIPVYNVREWLDECLQSIEQQSFRDFEVILIDDGSTDDSGQKCNQWSQKDSRFRVIHKENEGLSYTRNRGIKSAKGKYVVFVDADDWVDKDFLFELYNAAVESDADIAECDIYRYNDVSKKKTYRTCYGALGIDYTKDEHLVYGNTAIWKCLIKKDLFEKFDIIFPDCHSPARAIYALLIAMANKVVNVRKALYYYRTFRKNSLTDKPRSVLENGRAVGTQALEELIINFRKHQLDKIYEEQLERNVKYKLSDLLAANFYRREKEDFNKMVDDYQKLILEYFPNSKDRDYVTLGGYNLNRVTWSLNMLHNPANRFNFSSLISIVEEIKEIPNLKHKNKYREIMVYRDLSSGFWNVLKEQKPSYIFMNLIEERFDVCQYQGGYITLSDAYEGAQIDIGEGIVISRNTEECKKIWEKSCRVFIERITKEYPESRIVLIKDYLSEKIGDIDSRTDYENIEEIKEINKMLKEYYMFFEKECPSAIVVDLSFDDLYFTDKDYEYGAIPSHLNDVINRKIAAEIEKYI